MKSPIRCAIYTRKSTEEGLDQAYNSLDAQREACEAYIMSQTGEGWTIFTARYDGGGFSGGNLDRPALQALLADIDRGLIDTVVVYKIDRLTRALADFAKLVERFDKRNVSFVSVTQAFSTTTSMGRLTLNVLLSFAQFERELTTERIRDKFAASRRKGIFMGGKALARAHLWRDMIEAGEVTTVDELARGAGIERTHLTRMLRLAFLAPDIQQAILTGRQPQGLRLRALLAAELTADWSDQRRVLGFARVLLSIDRQLIPNKCGSIISRRSKSRENTGSEARAGPFPPLKTHTSRVQVPVIRGLFQIRRLAEQSWNGWLVRRTGR